jgi:L-iditol 2-dehydrogenase
VTLPESMRALVKMAKGKGEIEMRHMPVPQAGEDAVLVRVRAAGICGSDLKILRDEHPYFPPVVLGHEFSGEIVDKGRGVEGWSVGDRVVPEVHGYVCGRCRYCLSGKRHVCPSKRALGWGMDGGFAEYVKVPAWLLHRIPEGISYEEAALSEPMAIVVHGMLERARIEPEDFVVILGCGPLGLLALQMARAEGASCVVITGTDEDEKTRLRMALDLGVDYAVNVQRTDPVELVMQKTGGTGADLVVDLSGSPSAIRQGLEMVRIDGRFLAIGIPAPQEVSIPWKDLIFRVPQVIFHFSSCYTSWERTLSLIASGKVRTRPLISKVLDLSEWREGMRMTESREAVKVLLTPYQAVEKGKEP